MKARLLATFAYLKRVLARAHAEELGLVSSALAFNTLLALVPLFAVLSIFIARTLQEDDGRTLRLLVQLLPYSEEAIVAAIDSFVVQAETVQPIGLVGFVVVCVLAFLSVETALNSIFGTRVQHSLARRLLSFSSLLFWGPFLIGATHSGLLYLAQQPGWGTVVRESALVRSVPLATTFVGLSMLYWLVPNRSVRWRHAAVGGLVATIGLFLLQRGFAIYVAAFSETNRVVYGGFAIALFFVLSMQIAWWIVLFGCAAAATLELGDEPREDPAWQRVPHPWLALGALSRLAEARERGRSAVEIEILASELGSTAAALRGALQSLFDEGKLESVDRLGTRIRLAVPASEIRLGPILAAPTAVSPELARLLPDPVEVLAARLEATQNVEAASWTARDLLPPTGTTSDDGVPNLPGPERPG